MEVYISIFFTVTMCCHTILLFWHFVPLFDTWMCRCRQETWGQRKGKKTWLTFCLCILYLCLCLFSISVFYVVKHLLRCCLVLRVVFMLWFTEQKPRPRNLGDDWQAGEERQVRGDRRAYRPTWWLTTRGRRGRRAGQSRGMQPNHDNQTQLMTKAIAGVGISWKKKKKIL